MKEQGALEEAGQGRFLELRKNFFSQKVVKNWNGSSEEVVSAGSVNAFKGRLDEFRKWKDFLMDYVR